MLKTSIVINDQHIPYHDEQANNLIFKFIKHIKPNYIDILGDLIDFWQISKFLVNPARKDDIQIDIDKTSEYLKELRDLAPKSQITLHYGNHVCRLKHYIWRNAPKLDSIRSLNLNFLLNCEKNHIDTIEDQEGFMVRGKLVFTHGTTVSQDSAMTAKRNLQKYGLSVISGHTHRLGSHFRTDLRGEIVAFENGCLCKLDLIREWGRELANWQQGFSLVDFKDDIFRVQQIPIIKGKMLFGREEWS